MAKKLNRNLVGLLTLAGMLLLAVTGFALLANLPGQDPKVYETDARKLEDEKKYDEAGQTYIRAFHRDPSKNPEYLVKAAKCEIEDGKLGVARQCLRDALVRNPQLKSALQLTTEIELEVARLFGSTLQWNRVLNESKKLVKVEPQSPLAQQAMGIAMLFLQNEDDSYKKEGEEALKKALELDPTNTKVVDALARHLWTTARKQEFEGHKPEAEVLDKTRESILQTAIDKCGSSAPDKLTELKQLQSLFMIISGNPKEGMAILQSLVDSEKSKVEAHLVLASLYNGSYASKVPVDSAKAKEVLMAALAIDPKDGRVFEELSRTFKLQRRAEKDPEKRKKIEDEELAIYRRGLSEIPKTTHFRELKNNMARLFFYKELFLYDLEQARLAAIDDTKAAKREESLKSAEKWLDTLKQEFDADSVEVRYLTAQLYNSKGEYVEAIKTAEAAERVMGARGHFELEVLLGDLYSKKQQWGAARTALEKALSLNSNAFGLQVRLGQIYLQQNLPTQALMYLKADDPGPRGEYLRNDPAAIKLRMEAYRQLGQIELAQEEGKRLGATPENDIANAQLLVLNGKYSEAEAKLKAILDQDSKNINAMRVLLGLYRTSDRMNEARAFVKSLLAKEPENRIYQRMEFELAEDQDPAKRDERMLAYCKEEKDPFLRAVGLFDYYASKDQFDEAAKYLDEAEKLKPDAPPILDRQFRMALRNKDWDKAEGYVKKNAKLNVDGTEGAIAEGRLALAKKEYDKAIDLMRAGLRKFPTNSLGWTYLAEAYMSAGRRADAKNVLLEALKIDPTNGYANRALADMSLKDGEEKEAEKYLQAAFKAIPEDEWVRRQLQIVKEKENPKVGIASREKIRKENPKDLQNLILLARLYGLPDMAQYDKAAEVYREAYALSKNDLGLAREIAGFFGREDVNRPSEGEAILSELMGNQTDKEGKAKVATFMGQFFELQKSLATADRHFRLAVSLDPSTATLISAGEYYARTNRYRDSLEYYHRALKQMADDAPEALTTRSRIVALNLAIGDLDAARKGIDEFLAKYPNDAQGMIFEGAYHRVAGDVQQARKAFDSHLEKNPDNAVALWQRGQLFMLMGKWRQAIDDLSKAKTFNPNGFGYQHRISLAESLLEAGQGDLAVSELRSILDEKPDQESVAEALIDIYARMNPPRFTDAENLIYTYMRKYPRDYKWAMLLGGIGERSQNMDKAVQAYQKAAELSRYRSDAVVALLKACKLANRPQVIVDYAGEKLSTRMLESMPLALATIAWAYSKTKHDDKALETYDRALACAGSDVSVYIRIVREMVDTFGGDAALDREKKRAESKPEDIERQKVLVNLLQMSNKDQEALEVAVRLNKLAAKDTDITFSVLAQALLLERLHKYPESQAKYEEVLTREPDNVVALNNIAYLLSDEVSKPAEAIPYAERAKRLEPNNPEILDTLGWALSLSNRHGEAIGTLLRALQVDKDNVPALYHLGVAYMKNGETEEAKARLEAAKKAVEASKTDNPFLPKINEAIAQLDKAQK